MLLLAAIGLLGSCSTNKKLAALQQEKDALAASLSNIEKKVKMLEEDNSKLASEKNQLSQSINEVKSQLSTTQSKLMSVEKNEQQMKGELNDIRSELSSAFSSVESAVGASNSRIKELENMLYVDMGDAINFQTGSAKISADDKEVLNKIAAMLKANPNLHFIVEGHADKRPISTSRFKDNWDLSAARSIEVVRKLISLGVDPHQLTAAGRAEFLPSEAGSSKEAYAKNRRTEIIVVPNIGKLYEMHQKNKNAPRS